MIEFKEGDVFYAGGAIYEYWSKDKLVSGFGGKADIMPLQEAISYKDFQLNEPREGWYIPKSELDTEEKYNKAVEVFGLFGFSRTGDFALPYSKFIKHKGETALICANNELMGINAEHDECKTKCTYAQIMTIGELKRKMNERELIEANKAHSVDFDTAFKSSAVSKVNRDIERNTSEKPNSSEQVKNPSHYQLMDGVESIEVIARSMTQEQWKGFCLGNMIKYRIRAGKKDKLQQDIDKANFYGELYEMHKGKCYD